MTEPINNSCYFCSSRYKSVFSELGLEDSMNVDVSKKCMVFKKGQRIFEEGAYPHGVYCINNGKVKVTQTGADGKEQILHMYKNGDIMGYRSVLSGDTYSSSASALEDSSVCYIPVSVFTALVKKNMGLASKIISLFSAELKAAEATITDMAHKSVKERLAQSILLLKETYGCEKDGTINISITREDLAGMVGTAREVATRLLSEFNKEKIVELEGKKIKLLDPQKLVAIANIAD